MCDHDLHLLLDRAERPGDLHAGGESFDVLVSDPLVRKHLLYGSPAYRDATLSRGHLDSCAPFPPLHHADPPIMRQNRRPLVDLGGHLENPLHISRNLDAIFRMHHARGLRRHLSILSRSSIHGSRLLYVSLSMTDMKAVDVLTVSCLVRRYQDLSCAMIEHIRERG
jgi:hypothetical protein